jgi:propanol-preferring alcohol dehydrogenase
LLCAGVIGYRALHLSRIKPGGRIALYGFGASAHIALQIARHWNCESYVFTRRTHHRDLAGELGASWTGPIEAAPPRPTDAAVIFAPAGEIVPIALRNLRKGGTLALAGIHMTPIPAMEYRWLYEERSIISAANSTTDDVRALLTLAAQIPVRTEVETFPLEEANAVLRKLKNSELRGSGSLRVSN